MSDNVFTFGPSAEDDERDGLLFNVSEMARDCSFIYAVRISIGVKKAIESDENARQFGQHYKCRLWDVLTQAWFAIRRTDGNPPFIPCSVPIRESPGHDRQLAVYIVLDDTSGPAIHIILPSEYQENNHEQ